MANQPIQLRLDPKTLELVDFARGSMTRAAYVRAALNDRLTADLDAAKASITSNGAKPGGCDLSKYPLPVKAPPVAHAPVGQYL